MSPFYGGKGGISALREANAAKVAAKAEVKGASAEAGTIGAAQAKPSSVPDPTPPPPEPPPIKTPAPVAQTNCFTAGTLVWTAVGQLPIEEVEAGDLVWSYDVYGTREWQLCPVEACFAHEYDGLLVHVVVDGVEVCATENHPFWVVDGVGLSERPACNHLPDNEATYSSNGRWVGAVDLRVGDVLLTKESRMRIQSITRETARCMVFNLQVGRNHDYAAGVGVLVHNEGGTIFRGDDGYSGGSIESAGEVTAEKIVQHVLKANGDGTLKSFSTSPKGAAKFTTKGNVVKVKPSDVPSLRTIDSVEAQRIVKSDPKYSKQANNVKKAMDNNKEVLTSGKIPADKIRKAQ